MIPSSRALTVRSRFVLYLDVLLLVLFVLLLSPRMTGLPWHEILGLLFVAPIVVHLLIARPWTTLTVRTILRSGRGRSRVNLLLNTLLFVLMVIEIFSGLEISQVALPSLGFAKIDDRTWRALHNQTLNWVHLVVGLHIAMNWDWIVAAVRRVPVPGTEMPKRTFIAPTYGAAILWLGLMLLASALVVWPVYAELGRPTLLRFHRQDEIARFAPTLGHGAIQFLGESCLTAVVAYAGRKWLRMRL